MWMPSLALTTKCHCQRWTIASSSHTWRSSSKCEINFICDPITQSFIVDRNTSLSAPKKAFAFFSTSLFEQWVRLKICSWNLLLACALNTPNPHQVPVSSHIIFKSMAPNASVLRLYRKLLKLAHSLPGEKRSGAIQQIQSEFRLNRDEFDQSR